MNGDKYTEFKDGILVLATGTTYSNVIKIGKSGNAFKQSKLYAQITTAATSGGSATTQFILQTDDNEAFTSAVTVLDSGALAVATLVDDYVIFDRYLEDLVWRQADGSDTYLRIAEITAVADLTAGTVKSALTGIRPQNIL